MVDQADVFVKQGTAFFPGSALTGNGLLVSDGDEWRRQRRLSNPAFRKAAIEGYAGAMVGSTQAMLQKRWGTGQDESGVALMLVMCSHRGRDRQRQAPEGEWHSIVGMRAQGRRLVHGRWMCDLVRLMHSC